MDCNHNLKKIKNEDKLVDVSLKFEVIYLTKLAHCIKRYETIPH